MSIKTYLETSCVFFVLQSVFLVNGVDENLLENYLPASMQALAYYIDLLQYEPAGMTTVEPPFFAEVEEGTSTVSPTQSRTTTRKPTSSWFQSPSWWASSTQMQISTTTIKPVPTHKHKPGLYAPYSADMNYLNQGFKERNPLKQLQSPIDKETVGLPFNSEVAFIQWIRKQKPRESSIVGGVINNSILDYFPMSLAQDIENEQDDQDQRTMVEILDNFLRNYDDKYGKFISQPLSTGMKRIPPTKSYVEFLLFYDLLKRDAKAANLSKYEGYTENMINDLHELSSASPQRQLYTLFKKMLDRKEIQRSDVVTRAQKLIKELGDGHSVISKSLMYYPALQFLP